LVNEPTIVARARAVASRLPRAPDRLAQPRVASPHAPPSKLLAAILLILYARTQGADVLPRRQGEVLGWMRAEGDRRALGRRYARTRNDFTPPAPVDYTLQVNCPLQGVDGRGG
jgi:hypothetical protein